MKASSHPDAPATDTLLLIKQRGADAENVPLTATRYMQVLREDSAPVSDDDEALIVQECLLNGSPVTLVLSLP